MWIALVPQLHVALTSRTAKRAFLQGWFTGTLANTVAFFWMDGLLERFGHMSPLEALPIMLLLTAYQGLEFALLSWGVYRVHARTEGACPRPSSRCSSWRRSSSPCRRSSPSIWRSPRRGCRS